MAYAAVGFRKIAFGGAVAANQKPVVIASYVTNDLKSVVLGANYFDSIAAHLPKGSIIHCSADLDGTPVFFSLMVSANTGTVVTVIGINFSILEANDVADTMGTENQILKVNASGVLVFAADAT